MKITKEKIKQMIEEEAQNLLDEEATPQDFDASRFPMKLSQVNVGDAELAIKHGHSKYDKDPNDDEVSVNREFEAPVGGLKPSQSSMNIGKALGMALAMIMGKEGGGMPIGGNLGAFISSDNYIMDGHHRWIATAMVDPSQPVGGMQVGFPGEELVAILNAMTAGQFGITKGKAGSGGFDQFEEGPIRKQLLDYVKAGTPGEFGKGPDWVANAIQKFTGKSIEEGGVDVAVQQILSNLETIKPLASNLLDNAPDRSDMPVIDGSDNVAAVINALEKGHVDINPPYYDPDEEAEEPVGQPPLQESRNLMSISRERLQEIIKEELQNRKR